MAVAGLVATSVARVAGAATARKGSSSSSTSAASLIDASSLSRTLLSPVYATTDQGGASSGNGSFDSRATATTIAGADLTYLLSSFASATAAKQAYRNLTSGLSEATPVSGVGDEAVSSGQDVYVLKGAQVLQVTAKADDALAGQLSQIKASGGDPSAEFARVVQTAIPAARAAAGKMSGSSSTRTGFVLPKDGVDPCTVSAATVGKVYGVKGATAQPVLSEDPPATECEYSLPGVGGVLTFVTTGDQLYTPAFPDDIYAEFQKETGQDPAAFPLDDVFSDEMKTVELQEAPCTEPKIVKAEYNGSTELPPAKAKQALKEVADKAAGTPTPSQQPPRQPNPAQPALDAARAEAQALQTLLQAQGKLFTGDLSGFSNDMGKFSDEMGKFADQMAKFSDEMKKLADAVQGFCKARVGAR